MAILLKESDAKNANSLAKLASQKINALHVK